MEENAVGWFEIPVTDMQRAIKFYETVLNIKLTHQNFGGLEMAWFPHGKGYGAGGALVFDKSFYTPSEQGTLVYLTAHSGDLQNELARAEKAGVKVVQQKKQISPEHGYMALIIDSEGNRIALHSMK